MYLGITKNRNSNNFKFWWSLFILQISDRASMTPSVEGSQSTKLDDSNKPLEQCEQSIDLIQFAISYWWRIILMIFLEYLLSIPTRQLPLTWEYSRHCLITGFYYSLLQLEFDNSGSAGILNPDLLDQKWLCYHCAMFRWPNLWSLARYVKNLSFIKIIGSYQVEVYNWSSVIKQVKTS